MSTNKKSTLPMVIYLIILIGLIYAFHVQLLVAGVRLYTSMSHDPRSEHLLGAYYANNATVSTELSTQFYTKALQKYQTQLSTKTPKDQVLIKLNLGRIYECGQGVARNLATAKQWYEGALTSSKEAEKQNQKVNDKLLAEIKHSLENLNNPSINPACAPQTERQFIMDTFKHGY